MRLAKICRSLFGFVLALIGIILAVGGAWLLALGGSAYYVVTGLLLVAAGILYARARAMGFFLYAAAFIFTLLWSFWEAGLDPWALTPRLVGPLILMVLALLLLPTLPVTRGGRIRNLGLAGLLVGVLALSGLVYAGSGHPVGDFPVASADRIYDDTDVVPASADWQSYGGSPTAQRYADVDQITPANVGGLKRAWTYHTGYVDPKKYGSELTPLKIGDRVYGCTGMNELFAVDASTGKKIWSHDPKVDPKWIPYSASCRGVAFYKTPGTTSGQLCAERIIEGTLDMRLIAVDAATGVSCPGFGNGGEANLRIGLGQKDNADAAPTPLIPGTAAVTAPPLIVQGVVLTNHQVLDGQRRWAASGVIRGYDAVTGKLRFAWDMKRPDVTTGPGPDGYYSFGTPNSWAATTGDEKLGLAYIPTGNSAGDYWTSSRSAEERKFNSALVALDVNTGKVRWTFQTVHDDVWDYDLGSQPSLVQFPTARGRVPALILATKQGDIYVLDRATGKPLVPVQERRVPGGGAEPDQRSPTQPFSTYHTLASANLTEKDMWGLSPIDQMMCRIQFRQASYKGMYTPPEVGRSNIEWPGYNGGSDWGSLAIDPRRGVIIANYNQTANYNKLVDRRTADKLDLFPVGDPRSGKGGASAEGAGPQTGTPFAIIVNAGWTMPTGVLCTKPPYGGIRAIDLASGKTIWDRPFGTARRNGPFGIPSGLPFEIGTPNNGGAVVTKSGLIFVAAATDDLIRAIDIKTGKTVWSDVLPGGGQANPMIYTHKGKEYLVIMAGGHHFMMTPASDALVAYALP